MSIQQNIQEIRSTLPPRVKLIAVSKTKPNDMIMEAYATGQRVFGESKVQELSQKHEALPKDIEWHQIGHLQTNKVKYIAGFVHLIHSIDSLKLLQTVFKEAVKNKRIINCLLQMHIAREETKFGLSYPELEALLESVEYKEMQAASANGCGIKICGLMGMATFTDHESTVRSEFAALRQMFDQAKTTYFANDEAFKELSMGMSDDYHIAAQEGSTMVRVGSSLFGNRDYCAPNS